MRIAVTGGTGFLGSSLVALLRRKRVEVVILSRRTAKDERAGRVRGEIDDPDAVSALVEGADVVINNAGLIRSRDIAELRRVNVVGAALVGSAAARAGVARVVHVSTAGVYGRPGGVVCEHSEMRPHGPYERSKAASEAAIRRAFDGDLCIVRPSNLLGPGHPLRPLRRLVHRLEAGAVVVGAGARSNYVSVDAVAETIAMAATGPAVPGTLVINQSMPLPAFMDLVAHAAGVTSRIREIPPFLARTAEGALRFEWERFGRSGRALSLFDSTWIITAHEDFFEGIGPLPDLSDALGGMISTYRSDGVL